MRLRVALIASLLATASPAIAAPKSQPAPPLCSQQQMEAFVFEDRVMVGCWVPPEAMERLELLRERDAQQQAYFNGRIDALDSLAAAPQGRATPLTAVTPYTDTYISPAGQFRACKVYPGAGVDCGGF